MNIKKNTLRTLIAWLALGTFMVVFQPDKLPVVALIVPFVLLFVALYSTWSLGITIGVRLSGRTEARIVRSRRRLGVMVAGSIVLLLVLQSLGQLTVRDVLTLFAIVGLGYFFVARNRIDTPGR